MSMVHIGSDWHLGQRDPSRFGNSGRFEGVEKPTKEYNYQLIGDHYDLGKRDILWLLGDIVFEEEALAFIQKLPAQKKILIPGNHDWQTFNINMYDLAKTFDEVRGTTSYKGTWLSHFPIVESEFWRKQYNVHGHIHDENTNPTIRDDKKYVNVNADVMLPKTGRITMNWQVLMEMVKNGKY